MLMIMNLDPLNAHEDTIWLDLEELGFEDDEPFLAHDELTGDTYTWQGAGQYVFLHPSREPGHVLHLRTVPAPATTATIGTTPLP
jgi:starch synthase (maltosyl-transferring)